ncbi:MAG TPA: hypothetical protein PLQ15_02770 [Syntrophales bacterium]|nr:hypothetical protein [Syntrophobacterales bacterium]HNQ01383.1 hypothetical protein [Syntrophales bacterium]HNS54079.1 hypothetical protein [Syntrophales bacterium]HQL89499.1 hypothetical protein [Syntrophales bacterium]
MSADKMTVYVNGNAVELHRGMKVKHALIACDQSLYDAAEAGELAVRDAGGFTVGLEGSLRDGAKLYTSKPDE